MIIIATYNIKGGVGKTAAAVNLSWLAAQEGLRTLVWDLDPQGASSYYFRVKPRIKGGSKKLLQGGRGLDRYIRGTDFDWLDLLPADFSYRHMDRLLDRYKHPARILRRLLRPYRDDYDFVFLDCAPSISLTSDSVFAAADILLVPTIPTTLSLRTYQQLRRHFKQHRLDTAMLLPFFSMVDRRKQLHRNIVDHPPDFLENCLPTRIPYHSIVEQMGIHRAPVGAYAPSSSAARSYAGLWRDIKAKQHDNLS